MDNHHTSAFFIFWALIAAAALGTSAEAISFGTYQKQDRLTVPAGGYASAEILFWAQGSEEYSVLVRPLKVPPRWHAASVPETFSIGGAAEYPQMRNVLLSGSDTPIAARVVPVAIIVPKGEMGGTYEVSIEAVAGSEGAAQVSLAQSRIFNFRVLVISEVNLSRDFGEVNVRLEPSGERGSLPGIAEANLQGNTKNTYDGWGIAFFMSAAAVILYISWRVYRR